MGLNGVSPNSVNQQTTYTNENGGKTKPFNGGTVTVSVQPGASQADAIRAALIKFAVQAGIRDPQARQAFADKWIAKLGGQAAKLYVDKQAVKEDAFKNDKADGSVTVTLKPGENDAIIKDLRQLQVEKGVINILEANLIREEVTVTAESEPIDLLTGRNYQESLIFDPTQFRQRQLNSQLDDLKYQQQAQDPDLTELALDLTQMGLDVVGIFEPTPFADLTNTGISAVRGNWGDAALSVIGVIPYIGDVAKLGKIPKWLKAIEKISNAIDKFGDIVRNGGKGSEAVEAFMRRAKDLLDKIPFDKLPDNLRDAFKSLKKKIDDFFASVKKTDNPTDNIKNADNVKNGDNITDATKTTDDVPVRTTDNAPTQQIDPPQKPKKPEKTTDTPSTVTNPTDWNKNGTGLGSMVEQALKRKDLDADTLKSIDRTLDGLNDALKNGKLENTGAMRDLVSNLGKADPKRVSESLAELERASQVLKTADLAPGTKVVIGAREGQQLSRTTGLPDIDVAKVEADVYFRTKDGVLHLNEVKDTFNALTSKIDEGIKAANKGADPKQFERYGDWVEKGKTVGETREVLVVVRKSDPGFDALLDPRRIDELEKVVKGDLNKPVIQVSGRTLSVNDLRQIEKDAMNKLGELIAQNPGRKPAELAREFFGSVEKTFATLGKIYGKAL